MWKEKIRGFPILFLVANSLSWFTMTLFVIEGLLGSATIYDILMVAGAYFAALITSAFVGATLLYKNFRQRTFLLSWILFGVAACGLYAFTPTSSLPSTITASLILGASIGVGIPTCFAFFADQTKTENRGRAGATMFFVIQLSAAAILFSTDGMGIGYIFALLAVWRLLGAAPLFFYKPSQKLPEKSLTLSFSIIRERRFILFFLPWFLFTLVNFIEAPILEGFFGSVLFNDYFVAVTLLSSFSAFVGGAICDLKGRKIAGILGFVLLGMGYAFLSFFSTGSTRGLSQILYVVCDGLAWGILYVTFVFVIWGDLSEEKTREKYYLLGSMPFLLSGFIELLVQPFAESSGIPITTTFSLATFFLFLAILPLLYAPETLSEKLMRTRELKNYLAKAKKEVEKARGKEEEPEQEECPQEEDAKPKDDVEFEVGQEEMEKACELADKYY
jgi:MFS family permease